jgi:putative phosphoribosyl transferase
MYAPPVIRQEREIEIFIGADSLQGTLTVPPGAVGVVLFAHGSGSSRLSPRNRRVAAALQEAGLATLLFDLLTEKEEDEERHDAHLRFDIGFLAQRLEVATDWALRDMAIRDLPIGYFGASTGAAAALVAAASYPETVKAVVSRGGRPDLAEDALARVVAPTLLIVGREDATVLRLNQTAMRQMTAAAPVHLETIHGATHLFEEPGTLEEVSRLAADWFRFHLENAQRT